MPTTPSVMSTSSTLHDPVVSEQAGSKKPKYPGQGTEEDPFIVDWDENDPENPRNWRPFKKWYIISTVSIAVLALAFCSSAYAGGLPDMLLFFGVSQVVLTLGVSLFVLGFALGPLLWAPMSETLGRRLLFLVSYGPFSLFNIGGALANNIETMLITRLLCGLFGSSPLTNSGGVIADMFDNKESGLAMGVFAVAPFLGPVLGPIIAGFLADARGWRSVFWLMFAFTAFMFCLVYILVPETHPGVLLRRRAARLTKETGQVHVGIHDARRPVHETSGQRFKEALSRPLEMLFTESITIVWALYAALVYGILYLEFVAFPLVFQEGRGWSSGIGGLSFIGIGVGMLLGSAANIWYFNPRYVRLVEASPTGRVEPEARLYMTCVGGCLLPVGLAIFAATCRPEIHWAGPIIGSAPFGAGMILTFLSMMTYLVDVYLPFAASALAANSVLRSLFGAVFPLFGPYMYRRLGNSWASALVAFLALAFVPLPFIFMKYGARIRGTSKKAFDYSKLPAPQPKPAEKQKLEV